MDGTPRLVAMLAELRHSPVMADLHDSLERMQAAGHKGAFEQESLGLPRNEWPFHGA